MKALGGDLEWKFGDVGEPLATLGRCWWEVRGTLWGCWGEDVHHSSKIQGTFGGHFWDVVEMLGECWGICVVYGCSVAFLELFGALGPFGGRSVTFRLPFVYTREEEENRKKEREKKSKGSLINW